MHEDLQTLVRILLGFSVIKLRSYPNQCSISSIQNNSVGEQIPLG